MTKIVINRQYGGFDLSKPARALYMRYTGATAVTLYNMDRSDPNLIRVVEEMGGEANSTISTLKIVEIPDHIVWEIQDYDGMEWVAEKHETWC